jgi:hydrogenase maturation protein HypF
MGRLFDAVSALIGIRQTATYEGQAAIELENSCSPDEETSYKFELSGEKILIHPILEQILNDWHMNIPQSIISARFHNGLAQMVLELCQILRKETAINVVAFSGGVWQNITLLTKTLALLEQNGFTTLMHQQVPTNDGGISLGQSLIAANARKK